MKTAHNLAILVALSLSVSAQRTGHKEREVFRYPVLVKSSASGTETQRIGFLRYNDFWDVPEPEGLPENERSRFIKDFDLQGKYFVYIPLSEKSGEMILADVKDVTKLDLDYEQAVALALPVR